MKNLILRIIVVLALIPLLGSCFVLRGQGLPEEEDYGASDPTVTDGDTYESDDSINTAKLITAGIAYDHTIYQEGDVDYLKISLTAGKTYRVFLSSIKGFEPDLTVYAVDKVSVIEMKNTGTYTDVFDWWGYDKDRNYNADEREAIIFKPASSGIYYIRVKDIYDAHGQGSYKIRVDELIIISPVTTLTAFADQTNFNIQLEWTPLSGVDGYSIYRTTVDQSADNPDYTQFTLLTTVSGGNTAIYKDNSIEPDTVYYYYVKAYKGTKSGEPGNVASASVVWVEFKPSSSLIDAGEGLSGKIRIRLNTLLSGLNVVRYEVYRSENQYETPVLKIGEFPGSSPVGTYIDDSAVNAGVYYYYCVKVVISFNSEIRTSDYSYYDSGIAAP